uniref:phage tail tape measure protein n=1 Tax=Dialister sp. TaxID=1955814 RepID=UPI004025667E
MAEKGFSFNFTINGNLANGFSASFGEASSKIGKLTSQIKEFGKVGQGINGKTMVKNAFGGILATGGAKMIGMARGIGSDLMETSQAAIDFESSMADVKKVVDFDTPQQFKEMGNDILEMTKTIPMAAQDLAQIVAAGGQSGIAREDLTSFAESAAKMGVAFDISAGQAGDMMAKWRTAFKMNQTEVVDLADKINYLGNTTAASAPLISDVVTRIGPLGEVGGVAAGEIAALGASMVGSGIQSDVAATGLKNMILALTAGESATKSQVGALNELGLSAEDVAQGMQDNAKETILKVLDAIRGLDKVKQASVLSDLFGKESLGAIAPLLSNLDGVQDNLNKVADSSKYAGSMEGEFSARSETTANSLQLAKNNMEAFKIAIGNGLIPAMTPMISLLTQGVKWVSGIAQEFPGAASVLGTTAVSIAIFCGAVGALSTLAGTVQTVATFVQWAKEAGLATRIWTGIQWAWNAAMTANPVGVVIMGIAALIAIGYVLYQNWDTISSFAATMWEGGKQAIADFCGTISNKVAEVCDWVQGKWQALKDFLSHPIDALVNYNQSIGSTPDVATNAAGGIYNQGSFLTTFAEDSPEAAIPIDGSRRALGLWQETGRRLGALNASGIAPQKSGTRSTIINFAPQITIQGNADKSTMESAMKDAMSDLKRMLQDLQRDERRLSYG